MVPLRNVLVQNVSRAASADVSTDLPVNPLYMILYTLRFQQAAASDTADKIPGLAEVLALVSRIEVLFRGTTVFSVSLADAAVLAAKLTGVMPYIINQGDAANGQRSLTVPIFLGRPKMRGVECFPATRRGELTLRRLFASSFSLIDTSDLDEQIETVELLGAEPRAFSKVVSIAKTWPATGDQDLDLPLGNTMAGVLLYGTTGYAAAASAASWSSVKLLVDNVEHQYAKANWETLQGELRYGITRGDEAQGHAHTENLAAAYAQDVAGAKPRVTESVLDNYGCLCFDMFGDDTHLLETAGRGRVHLRATAGTADAVRAVPMEVVALASQSA
jgi:hypothetical protein